MFQFMTSNKVIFGEGALNQSLTTLGRYGYSVLLVTGRGGERAEPVINYLMQQGMRYQQVAVWGEPVIAMVEELAAMGRRFKPDMIVAIGGGSVLDVGKALSAIIPNQGSVYDYVEVIGRNLPFKNAPLPCIAIPTNAGTGSEVTRNAVLKSAQEKIKVNIRNEALLPDVAIIDPTLTYGMDKALSARSGMDAFTHLMEAYVCNAPNPFSDMVCEEGLKKLSNALFLACEEDDFRARADMSFAAMLGGMARSNASLGAAHGLAAALGGRLTAPHGAITARLAPFVMAENILVAEQMGRNDVINRYRKLGVLLTGDANAKPASAIDWVKDALIRLEIPSLQMYGLCRTMFTDIADDALRSTAIKGNPLPLTKERLEHILSEVCQCTATVEI
ncbi:iron-containing alcohol dehydrogenase [Thaumasiovibrio subtropicus]|uniref:iron-containing alcohol dehydrogenase n=1 Tax=Thaumasiovibrio subtropicus TaxID=1891207 RepID=UPI000B364513|nr:iron-containing alcohol dehydrogenase [Thaumasiovibrio subtropicus]